MNVSIIIPAYNAAGTIAETIACLRAQTYAGWEAIVVDDGSNDKTIDIVSNFAKQDPRINVFSQPRSGVSAARNTGIGLARHEWLLFLDADDWLLPSYLERMVNTLISGPRLDAVYCGWVLVAPDGKVFAERLCSHSGDLFHLFASYCAFPIHACVVRRSLVEAVGGFDPSLRTCEDWDFWQRIARTGARFGAVSEVLARYRVRPNSISNDGFRLFEDGSRVLRQGHSSDPRVRNPHSEHEKGLPEKQFPAALLYLACWCAGLLLGQGQDPRPLLERIENDDETDLDAESVSHCIVEAISRSLCRSLGDLIKSWPNLEGPTWEFLFALEGQSRSPRLAYCARKALERKILEHFSAQSPLALGRTHVVKVEVTEPIPDIAPPASVERLQCNIEMEGMPVGVLELPVCDGIVPKDVLADAVVAEFAWPILGRFFERTVYRDLKVLQNSNGLSLWRGNLCLAEGLPEDGGEFWHGVHDRVGWVVFLQEIWNRHDWSDGHFYQPHSPENVSSKHRVDADWVTVEVSADLPNMKTNRRDLHVVLTVGGIALGTVTIPVKKRLIKAQELRAALIVASGLELCRAAVREGVLGRALTNRPTSLRDRLTAAAAAKESRHDWEYLPRAKVLTTPLNEVPDSALYSCKSILVLPRRHSEVMGTSSSRRAVLPAAAAEELIESASIAGEPTIRIPSDSSEPPERVLYVPDLIYRPPRSAQIPVNDKKRSNPFIETGLNNREYFEQLFARQPDPWKYTSPYEQTKYEQTLSLLPSGRIERALELACAEGHFTAQLAPRVESLVAADISQIALDRAARRCASLENVRFVRVDFTKEPLPGCFDLIVCSEVLYFVDDLKELQAIARKFVNALNRGGHLLMAHANLVVDEPNRTGFDWNYPFGAKVIGETFSKIRSLQLVRELRTPLYRIQVFQRDRSLWNLLYRRNPEVKELTEQPTPLLSEVAAQISWNGGRPRRTAPVKRTVTERLPILLYHRVAPAGSAVLARYRVAPEAFEEQLSYLNDSGYHSVSLKEWHTAIELKRPLPGRAVLITFDDGYLDFMTYAWPLLKRYGFSPTVFLVAEEIGGINKWDHMYGEEIPLLGWKEILQLRKEGVEFGSHSVSHPPLTELSPEKIVREGARSRTILQRYLGEPIPGFAYPYGDTDGVVRHLIGACGYVFGLSCRPDLSRFHDSLLELPRIEIVGSDGLEEFVAKLGRCSQDFV